MLRFRSPVPRLPRPFFLATAATWLLAAGCATAPPQIAFDEIPSPEVLYRKGQSLLDGQRMLLVFRTVDYVKAVETFQEIIDNYPYSEEAVLAELAIADSYFAQGRYDEALSYYQDFPDLHPNHDQVPYTIYRGALCYARQSHDASRDQSATKHSLAFLDRLLSSYPLSPQSLEAEKLWKNLRTRLGEHEMTVGDFYLQRDEYVAAAERYRDILNEYPGLGLDAQALYKLGLCYTRMNQPEEARRFFEVLLENYEGTEIAENAAELVPSAR